MSYGAPSAGYGQPNLQQGMPVSSDNGWTGTIIEIIPAGPGYEGAVRVAWHGDGTTLVALSMFVVENGQAIIRSQPPPPPIATPQAPQQMMPQPRPSEDDLATRLATPVQNDPSHVNPYVNDTPLVTPEPPPIHPTHGGQMRDENDDLTYVPPVPRQEARHYHGRFRCDGMFRQSSAKPMPTDAGMTMPLDAAHEAGTRIMDAGQQEVTVPVMEEQVEAHPEWRDAGSIIVRTVAEEIPQTLTRETQREELFVERVAVGRELAEGEEVLPREEGDTYVIPIIVEEAVVVTRRLLAEELRITKRVIPTMQTVQTVVRKERVEIDAGNLADRVHDAGGTDAATDPPQAPRTDIPS